MSQKKREEKIKIRQTRRDDYPAKHPLLTSKSKGRCRAAGQVNVKYPGSPHSPLRVRFTSPFPETVSRERASSPLKGQIRSSQNLQDYLFRSHGVPKSFRNSCSARRNIPDRSPRHQCSRRKGVGSRELYNFGKMFAMFMNDFQQRLQTTRSNESVATPGSPLRFKDTPKFKNLGRHKSEFVVKRTSSIAGFQQGSRRFRDFLEEGRQAFQPRKVTDGTSQDHVLKNRESHGKLNPDYLQDETFRDGHNRLDIFKHRETSKQRHPFLSRSNYTPIDERYKPAGQQTSSLWKSPSLYQQTPDFRPSDGKKTLINRGIQPTEITRDYEKQQGRRPDSRSPCFSPPPTFTLPSEPIQKYHERPLQTVPIQNSTRNVIEASNQTDLKTKDSKAGGENPCPQSTDYSVCSAMCPLIWPNSDTMNHAEYELHDIKPSLTNPGLCQIFLREKLGKDSSDKGKSDLH